jgi:hypothetical protein
VQQEKAFAAQQENTYFLVQIIFADPWLRATDRHPRNLRRISKKSPALRGMLWAITAVYLQRDNPQAYAAASSWDSWSKVSLFDPCFPCVTISYKSVARYETR